MKPDDIGISLDRLRAEVPAVAQWDREEDVAVTQVDGWLAGIFGPRPACGNQVIAMLQHLLGAEIIEDKA